MAAAGKASGRPGAFSSAADASTLPSTFFSTPGGSEVVANLLRTGYLWERVRVQGGAYGGFASLSHTSGALTFASYRDPHLDKTLETFAGAATHLRDAAAAGASSSSSSSSSSAAAAALRDELRKAILSTIGGIDTPLSPAERGSASTARYVSGITEEMIQERREQVLDAGVDGVEAFARAAEEVGKAGRVAVVGSEAAFAASGGVGGKAFRLFRPLQKAGKAEMR
jgi:Zn-dependent M16 (insulinase) family peptidase